MDTSNRGPTSQPVVIPLWEGGAPGSEHWTHTELAYLNVEGEQMVRNVTQPTLTVYLPDPTTATGTAMIVAPGGGFLFQSWEIEGTAVAQWLQAHGVAACVLKYRLRDTGATAEAFQEAFAALERAVRVDRSSDASRGPKPFDPEARVAIDFAIADGRQAVRLVRQRAAEWGIAADRIGLMGFSAGAGVTVGVATQHDTLSRPDFIAPIYGGGFEPITVPTDAMPLFSMVADNDVLAATGCVNLYAAWRAAGHSAELHIYAKGGHGFGMRQRGLPVDTWIERLYDWLTGQGLLTARS